MTFESSSLFCFFFSLLWCGVYLIRFWIIKTLFSQLTLTPGHKKPIRIRNDLVPTLFFFLGIYDMTGSGNVTFCLHIYYASEFGSIYSAELNGSQFECVYAGRRCTYISVKTV